ncbi:MAG: PDZ domain-containing protein [Terracidiphilus sp.]
MTHVLRPHRSLGFLVLIGAWAAMAPPVAAAQTRSVFQQLKDHTPLLHSNSQGYLGVYLADVDQQSVQTLKLKEVRGAIITMVDHDAPAGKIGLKVSDVVLQLNGQKVTGAEQLRQLLSQIPAGRTVNIEISRDGNLQTLTVQLADRRTMEHDVWNKIGTSEDALAQGPELGIQADESAASPPGGFHLPSFGSLNVGALVEPLTAQMAEYLGVPNGLMVKQVARKSEAAVAGLRAFDVILKVGPETVKTMGDWERALHAHRGRQVQVTVLRDRKQQTITLQVDSKHCGKLERQPEFPAGNLALLVTRLSWLVS